MRREAIKPFLTGLLALGISLAVWEEITRNLIFSRPPDIVVEGLGHIRPGGKETRSTEGFSRTWFDSEGYRDGKPATRPKRVILTLGDSYTEAQQVSVGESFAKRLENGLKAKGQDVWVANPSTSGGSPARYVFVADWYKKHLDPDKVVIALNLGDFRDDLLTQQFKHCSAT